MTAEQRIEHIHAAEDQVLDRAQLRGWIHANVPNGMDWHDARPPQRVLDCEARILKRAERFGLDA